MVAGQFEWYSTPLKLQSAPVSRQTKPQPWNAPSRRAIVLSGEKIHRLKNCSIFALDAQQYTHVKKQYSSFKYGTVHI